MEKESQVAEKTAQVEVAMGVLKELTKQERLVLALFYFEDLSVSAIGTILEKEEQDIRQILLRVNKLIAQNIPVQDAGNELVWV